MRPLKGRFLRLPNAQVKICQIPHVNFETTSRFLSKFCVTLQCHESKLLCTFLAQAIYTLTVCFYHVTYAFQSESTLYSCLNVKELLARSRREI